MCNIPVHQSCYGIDSIPEEDWICYACKVFTKEEAEKIPCVLCPQLGGAMKPTSAIYNRREDENGNPLPPTLIVPADGLETSE